MAMIFRLSQKLTTKIKAGRLEALPAEENLFAEAAWFHCLIREKVEAPPQSSTTTS